MRLKDGKRIDALDLFPPAVRKRIEEATRYPPLPDWPVEVRGIPNICLRSALFGLVQRGRRRAVKGELLASVKGISIRYTGWRLDQGDFDVLLYALNLVSLEKSTKDHARFTGKGFLRAIGRTSGKSGREWLKDSFRRLTGSAVEITFEVKDHFNESSYTYAGSLVDEFYYSSDEGCYLLKINPKLAKLFDAGWTQMQWQQRRLLKTDLAKWLHGFYASHRAPYPIKVNTLKLLCGSSYGRLSDFRSKLRRALHELVNINLLESWEIDEKDKVHVVKRTSKLPS
ncbi:plasmid replication initiator TrfA [Desulfopila sp. IMCC35008]|uniref:plasmid replication initiator TrfA n=1 Tax=Desulfopila sp. IMCC35008 TaxID=2653858 RepID=UPI0013D18367|nr:plasmid replication initiator TrfA [Desulfopila sp. IMCC35008]